MSDGQTAPDAGADALRDAAETMRIIRERCVWSQRITHEDLVPYLIEEAAELVDAVEVGSRDDLREELGDVLWQVLFHTAVAATDPDDPFDLDDVARSLTEKMVRRHPHVFAGEVANTPEEVLVHWNAAKAAEKHARRSVLDGVSPHMPALAHAQKLLGKAAQVGVTPVGVTLVGVTPVGVAPGAADEAPGAASEDELGDRLMALVAAARARGWDAERALRGATRRLEAEIRAAEGALPEHMPPEETPRGPVS